MSKIVDGYIITDNGKKILYEDFLKQEDRAKKIANRKNIAKYDNILEIVVNEFKCEYHECGSHQMLVSININKEELIKFLDQINLEKLKEED